MNTNWLKTAWLAAVVFCTFATVGPAHAAVTEISKAQVAGSPAYNGVATRILYFTGSDGNPTVQEVATALAYQGPVDAAHCQRLDSDDFDSDGSGTLLLNGVQFTYTFNPLDQRIYFDWDSNAPVMWVTAKGGDEAYVYSYLVNGAFEDFLLRSPDTNSDGRPQGLSHFDFCFQEPPPSIRKTVTTVWNRYYDWDLLKWVVVDGQKVEQQNHVLFYGDSAVSNYLIEATPTAYGLFTVSGKINISALPDTTTVVAGSVSDTLIFGADSSNFPHHPAVTNCQSEDPGGVYGVIHSCDYTITLDSKTFTYLAAGGAGVNAAAASVVYKGVESVIATGPDNNVAFNFSSTPQSTHGATLDLEDSLFGGENAPPADHQLAVGGPLQWSYPLTFNCPDHEGNRPNTVVGTWGRPDGSTGTDSDGALVTLTCNVPPPVVEKVADGSWIRYYKWRLDKSVLPATLTMEYGDPAENGNYTVTAVPTSYGKFTVSGTVVVKGNLGVLYTGVDVTDALSFSDAGASNPYPVTLACTGLRQPTAADLSLTTCTYSRTFDNRQAAFAFMGGGDAGLNTATATVHAYGKSAQGSGNDPFGFGAVPNDEVGEILDVDDLLDAGGLLEHAFDAGNLSSWTYSRAFQCGRDRGARHNVATGTWEDPEAQGGVGTTSDDATITILCTVPPPVVDKTATGRWDRYYDWTLSKSADPTRVVMYDGDSHDVDYTVTASYEAKSKNFVVSGTISVHGKPGVSFDSIVVDDDLTVDGVLYPDIPLVCTDDTNVGQDNLIEYCTYTFNVPASQAGLQPGDGGSNIANVTVTIGQDSATSSDQQAFTFVASAPANTYGGTLNATDSMQGAHAFTLQDLVWQYTRTYACGTSTLHTNTVEGTWDRGDNQSGATPDPDASASVDVQCRTVTVRKTASTSYDRDYGWTPDKKIVVRANDVTEQDKGTYCTALASGPYAGSYLCDDIVLRLLPDAIYDTVYALNARRSIELEDNFTVAGTITISWPADAPDPVFNPAQPSDVLQYLSPALSVGATVGGCTAGVDSLGCPYQYVSNDVGIKRDGLNVASIIRPWVCYDADGIAKACGTPGSSTYTGSQPFSFGTATVAETDQCVAMQDVFNAAGDPPFNIGPSYTWLVDGTICEDMLRYVTGDINPDPGIVNSLDILGSWGPTTNGVQACRFVVPNLLNLALGNVPSGSDEAVITVDACDFGCTLTQGYWKTHANYAAKPQFSRKRDATWDLLPGGAAENTAFFNSGRTWIVLLHEPTKGEAYIQLAHQYMAARLNVLGGASVPGTVQSALDEATAMFQAAGASFGSAQTRRARELAGILGSYNEGAIGPGHCAEAPTRQLMMIK